MTNEERREAERLAEEYMQKKAERLAMTGEDLELSELEQGYFDGYAAACEAKQRVIDLCAQDQQLLTDRGLRMQRLYEAERARSAKLLEALRKIGTWAMREMKDAIARGAIAEYFEAGRD